MRTFGKKSEKYFTFQLEDDEKVYMIPLASALPYGILNEMAETVGTGDRFATQVKMLRTYMGDVVDTLPVGTLSDILQAWGEESNRTGATVGES